MGIAKDRRYVRLVALAAFAVVLAGMAVVLVGIAVTDRPAAIDLAGAHIEHQGEPQETPLDAWEVWPYVAALVICGAMLLALRRRPERLPTFVFLAALAALLLWRELPWDEQVLGANTLSWAKYLGNAEIPLAVRLAFGVGSMAVIAALVAYAVWRRRDVWGLLREKVFSLSSLLLVLAGVALVVSQAFDKHRTTDHLLGTNLSAWALKDYAEESLELVGATLVAMACLMAALEEPRRRQALGDVG